MPACCISSTTPNANARKLNRALAQAVCDGAPYKHLAAPRLGEATGVDGLNAMLYVACADDEQAGNPTPVLAHVLRHLGQLRQRVQLSLQVEGRDENRRPGVRGGALKTRPQLHRNPVAHPETPADGLNAAPGTRALFQSTFLSESNHMASQVLAVSPENHGQKSWRAATNYQFAAAIPMVSVVLSELGKVASIFPMALVERGGGYRTGGLVWSAERPEPVCGPPGPLDGPLHSGPAAAYPFSLAFREGQARPAAVRRRVQRAGR
jgi:hypothetical protein